MSSDVAPAKAGDAHSSERPATELVRVQLSRKRGWKMMANTVVVSRPSKYGNPWTIAGARAAGYRGTDAQLAAYCVRLYREWLTGSPSSLMRMLKDSEPKRDCILNGVAGLRGKNLACWCALGQPCHADVLLELANKSPSRKHRT